MMTFGALVSEIPVTIYALLDDLLRGTSGVTLGTLPSVLGENGGQCCKKQERKVEESHCDHDVGN